MTSHQLEIIAAVSEDLMAAADDMRRSRLTQYADTVDRKARIIQRIATSLMEEEKPCHADQNPPVAR